MKIWEKRQKAKGYLTQTENLEAAQEDIKIPKVQQITKSRIRLSGLSYKPLKKQV